MFVLIVSRSGELRRIELRGSRSDIALAAALDAEAVVGAAESLAVQPASAVWEHIKRTGEQ